MDRDAAAPANLFVCLVAICAGIGIALTGIEAVEDEQGVVEAFSALALGAALIFFWRANQGQRTAGAIVLVFLLARELDFDKRIFQHGIFSLKLYTGGLPIWQKLVGLALALPVLSGLILVAGRGIPALMRGLRDRESWAWLIAGAALLAVAGKALDGIGRKLGTFGIRISWDAREMAQMVEETMELAGALLLVLAVVRLPPVRAQTKDPQNGRVETDRPFRHDHLDGEGAH